MTEVKVNPLFAKIVTECIATNSIRPEYEMWLTQEIRCPFPTGDAKTLYKYLNSIVPDAHGWVWWFLSLIGTSAYESTADELIVDNSRERKRVEYLHKSKECGHGIAICEYIASQDIDDCRSREDLKNDVRELEVLYRNGNHRAGAYLYEMIVDCTDNGFSRTAKYLQLAHESLYAGVRGGGDFYCAYITNNKRVSYNNYVDSECEDLATTHCRQWGVHTEYNRDYSQINYYGNSTPPEELAAVAANLITMEIPCGYSLMGFVHKDSVELQVYNWGTGAERGCRHCDGLMSDGVHYNFMYKLIRQNMELRSLHGLSLESVVKNIIGEYTAQ